MADNYKLNYPVSTDLQKQFWGSMHKCNRLKSIIAFSLDLHNANDNLGRFGYPFHFRKRALKAFGNFVNHPDLTNVPFSPVDDATLNRDLFYYEELDRVWDFTGPMVLGFKTNLSATKSGTVGQPVTFTVEARGGTTPYTYKWFKGSTAISGATSATYTIAASATTDNGVYHVEVSDSANPAAKITSVNCTLTVTASVPALVWTTHPATGTIGTNVGFAWSGGTAPYNVVVVEADGTTEHDNKTDPATTYTLSTTTQAAGNWKITVTDSASHSITQTIAMAAKPVVPVITAKTTPTNFKVGDADLAATDLFSIVPVGTAMTLAVDASGHATIVSGKLHAANPGTTIVTASATGAVSKTLSVVVKAAAPVVKPATDVTTDSLDALDLLEGTTNTYGYSVVPTDASGFTKKIEVELNGAVVSPAPDWIRDNGDGTYTILKSHTAASGEKLRLTLVNADASEVHDSSTLHDTDYIGVHTSDLADVVGATGGTQTLHLNSLNPDPRAATPPRPVTVEWSIVPPGLTGLSLTNKTATSVDVVVAPGTATGAPVIRCSVTYRGDTRTDDTTLDVN